MQVSEVLLSCTDIMIKYAKSFVYKDTANEIELEVVLLFFSATIKSGSTMEGRKEMFYLKMHQHI